MDYDLGDNANLDSSDGDSDFQGVPEVTDDVAEFPSDISEVEGTPTSEAEPVTDLREEPPGIYADVPEVPAGDFESQVTPQDASSSDPSMDGAPVDAPLPDTGTPKPAGDEDPFTIHAGNRPEFEPNPEPEAIPHSNPEGGSLNPPEGWHPGGPEGGG
jgi:hypothetical protein